MRPLPRAHTSYTAYARSLLARGRLPLPNQQRAEAVLQHPLVAAAPIGYFLLH